MHDMPGTTRDAVDTVVDTEIGPLRFVDTAGMRRKSRIDEGTEYFDGPGAQGGRRVRRGAPGHRRHRGRHPPGPAPGRTGRRAGCPIVVLLNKWELLDEDRRKDVLYQLGQRLHFLGDSAVLRISALTGRACTDCCRPSRTRSTPTTPGSRPVRSTT